ncbi:cupredoxin domain-containing protein [Marispirochaeta aestuarii]|uniref:cupredoxin domain-containing protein n=1 Tax=Marispirochaeta aestuarii TaxID=1963862 RepID=UPI0029C8BDC1|nr:cupredoxin domain-containing protein [Marispirochaeta aestuarii]
MKKLLFIALLSAAFLPLAAQEVVDLSGQGPGVKEISVTNEGFDYMPKEIRVKKGDTIRLTYTNGGGFHDWVLDEFDAATRQIPGGRSETIEFVADRSGEFEFYCSVGNHRARGMWGKFIVVE